MEMHKYIETLVSHFYTHFTNEKNGNLIWYIKKITILLYSYNVTQLCPWKVEEKSLV